MDYDESWELCLWFFSELDSKKFCLRFLFVFARCFFFYYLLVLWSTTHYSPTFVDKLPRVETEIHQLVYSCREGGFKPLRISSFCYSKPDELRLNNGKSLISLNPVDPQQPPSCVFKIKIWVFVCHKRNLQNKVGTESSNLEIRSLFFLFRDRSRSVCIYHCKQNGAIKKIST